MTRSSRIGVVVVMSAAATLKAVFIANLKPEIYFMDQVYQSKNFTPDVYVDFTPVADRKWELVRLYACQNREGGMERRLKDAGRFNAMRSNLLIDGYAEAFTSFVKPLAGAKSIFDELPPPAAIPPDSRWQGVPKASAGAKAVFGYADKCGPRYDLALEALYNLFRDEKSAASDRVTAAMRIAALHSEMRERPQAVKALEDALAIRNITSVERGKLCLKRVNVMMTDEKFEEKYTAAQLDAASAALDEALKVPGVGEAERSEAVCRMARGYLAAKEYGKCIGYAEARMKDTKLPADRQAALQISIAEAAAYQQDWGRSLKAYKEAHRILPRIDVIYWRSIVAAEARVAEKAKDYERAVLCWMEMIPTWDPTVEGRAINAAKEQVRRLQPLARKGAKLADPVSSDDDSGDAISLDE